MSCSWRFTNLNVAFRLVVGEPTRSLHVYSDVEGSSIVGNRVTDLLREVEYKKEGRGTIYFEPLHIQYMSFCNEVIKIIQTLVTETNGELVKFGEETPLSRYNSKRHKKKKTTSGPKTIMPQKRGRRRRRQPSNPTATTSTIGWRDKARWSLGFPKSVGKSPKGWKRWPKRMLERVI